MYTTLCSVVWSCLVVCIGYYVGLHIGQCAHKNKIFSSSIPPQCIRRQLEHGVDYMQGNVNNQTQFCQIRLDCDKLPNAKTICAYFILA